MHSTPCNRLKGQVDNPSVTLDYFTLDIFSALNAQLEGKPQSVVSWASIHMNWEQPL